MRYHYIPTSRKAKKILFLETRNNLKQGLDEDMEKLQLFFSDSRYAKNYAK